MTYLKDSTNRRRRLFTAVVLLTLCIGALAASSRPSSGAAVSSSRESLPETFEAVPPAAPPQDSFSQTVPQGLPAFIYLVGSDGILRWYRHNGAESGAGLETQGAWAGGLPVGRGWNGLKAVFGGGGDTIYGIGADGLLKWYRHVGFNTGAGLESPTAWLGARDVGRGWGGLQHVFSGGNGIIYTIADDGILRWYRHNGFRTGVGLETPGAWEGPKAVGRGWGGLRKVFSGGDGVIYTIADDGILRWYRHNGFRTGAGLETPGAWAGPKPVGRGWGGFNQVFSPGRGIIYGVAPDGILKWFKHNGFQTGAGLETAGAWTGPKDVGRGWGEAIHLFALMPSDPPPIH
jgi:hypothetical protein